MSKKNKGSSAKKSNKKAAKPVKKGPAKKNVAKKSAKASPAKSKPVKSAKKTAAVTKPLKKAVSKKPVSKTVVKNKPKVIAKTAEKKIVHPPIKSAKKTLSRTKPVIVQKAKSVDAKATNKEKNHSAKTAVKPVVPVKKITQASPAIPKNTVIEKPVEKEAEVTIKKQSDSKPNEVLAISNTIPVSKEAEISASKIASISSSITNPVKKVDSYSIKSEREPSGKFEMEIVVRSSPELLYEFLSTPSGLSEWFCDDVNIRNGIYTFIWEGQLQQARLLKTVDDQLVRFQWVDKIDGSFFEFKIQRDDLTNDISLIVTDFAESASEKESSKLLWQSQIEKLLHIMGSI